MAEAWQFISTVAKAVSVVNLPARTFEKQISMLICVNIHGNFTVLQQ